MVRPELELLMVRPELELLMVRPELDLSRIAEFNACGERRIKHKQKKNEKYKIPTDPHEGEVRNTNNRYDRCTLRSSADGFGD
jgi:hypothetical protein